MGNDGGSIPTRRELVKTSTRTPTLTDLKAKQKEHLAHRWSQCPISHTALRRPIVSDCAGNLYNKDAIIAFLLPEVAGSGEIDRAEAEKFLDGRVRGLKDVVEVLFDTKTESTDATVTYICPVTGKELGPNVKAVYLVPCGHAFSREAIDAMKDDRLCVSCSTPYEARDIIPLLPSTDTDKATVIERMKMLKELGLTHALKKDKNGTSKKRKMKETEVTDAKNNGTLKAETISGSGIKNSSTANLTARVLEEEAGKKKRRMIDQENENIQSLYSKSNGGQDAKNRNTDFMTRGFSITTAGNGQRQR